MRTVDRTPFVPRNFEIFGSLNLYESASHFKRPFCWCVSTVVDTKILQQPQENLYLWEGNKRLHLWCDTSSQISYPPSSGKPSQRVADISPRSRSRRHAWAHATRASGAIHTGRESVRRRLPSSSVTFHHFPSPSVIFRRLPSSSVNFTSAAARSSSDLLFPPHSAGVRGNSVTYGCKRRSTSNVSSKRVCQSHLCTRLPSCTFLLCLFCKPSIKVQVAHRRPDVKQTNMMESYKKRGRGLWIIHLSISLSLPLPLLIAPFIAVITHPLFFDVDEK